MNTPYDISVVIPCYNQARFLGHAIDSVLASQPLAPGGKIPRLQMIVVNDGSPDNTREVAAPYAGQITYLEQANGRVCRARNRGILEARGELLHFLDADDCVPPDFYARMLAASEASPDVSLFIGSCQMVDGDLRPLWLWKAEQLPPGDPLHAWLRKVYGTTSTIVVRRRALAASGLWDPSFEATEDWDLWIRLVASGARSLAVPDATVMYRRYQGSITSDFEMMYYNGLRMLRSHTGHHGKCAECRKAVRAGIRQFRAYCMRTSYWPSVGRYRRSKGYGAALWFVARTCWGEPVIAAGLARNLAGRLLGKKAPDSSTDIR